MSSNLVIQRAGSLVLVLFGVLLITFTLMQLTPGDPAVIFWRMNAGNQKATPEDLQRIRVEFGLNDPLPVQFANWLSKSIRLDFGKSIFSRRLVRDELADRLPYTIALTLAAATLSLVFAIPLGVVSALRPNSMIDNIVRIFAVAGTAVPSFWLGLLLMYFVAYRLELLPAMGAASPRHVVLPALTLALGFAAPLARLMRGSMLEVLGEEYIRTAHAKGLAERTVVWKHALKNALIPLVSLAGVEIGFLVGGSVVVETVFAWPGIGKLATDAVFWRDYPVIRAFVLLMGVVFAVLNCGVDILYGYIDPRIRQGGGDAGR